MSVYNPPVVVCAFSVPSHASVGIYLKDGEFDLKETLFPLPPLPLDVVDRFSTLSGVFNGILCVDFATPAAPEIYALCNITNSSVLIVQSIQPTSDNSFGGNSGTGHECIVRIWMDDLHGIPSSMSVYDTLYRTWSAIQQLLCDVSQIYDEYIHIMVCCTGLLARKLLTTPTVSHYLLHSILQKGHGSVMMYSST
ncbi:uncharacterized protein G2W53_027329 [Senna tora]|uniref:Uncharacterized protein n=1 Tax=Senna tora TaxID=362788 RepID=A0A834TIU5_9FABA|nr:uncharacterized protein G2W53_027329 [Senna tora]